MGDLSLEHWGLFGSSSQQSSSPGCSRKSWAALTREDHIPHLPGVSGSHLRRVLPGAPHTLCPQSLGGAVSHKHVPSGFPCGVHEAPQVSAVVVL